MANNIIKSEKIAPNEKENLNFLSLFPERADWLKRIQQFGFKPPQYRDPATFSIDPSLPNVLIGPGKEDILTVARALSLTQSVNVLISIVPAPELTIMEDHSVILDSVIRYEKDEFVFYPNVKGRFTFNYLITRPIPLPKPQYRDSPHILPLCHRKDLSHQLLEQDRIPVPYTVHLSGKSDSLIEGISYLSFPEGAGLAEKTAILQREFPEHIQEVVVKPVTGFGGKKIRFFPISALEDALVYAESFQEEFDAIQIQERIFSHSFHQTERDWNIRVFVSRNAENELVVEKPYIVRYSSSNGPVNFSIDAHPTTLAGMGDKLGLSDPAMERLNQHIESIALRACTSLEDHVRKTQPEPNTQQDLYGVDILVDDNLNGFVLEMNEATSGGMGNLAQLDWEAGRNCIRNHIATICRRARTHFLDASEISMNPRLPNVLITEPLANFLEVGKELARAGRVNVGIINVPVDTLTSENGVSVTLDSLNQFIDGKLCLFTDLELNFRIDYILGDPIHDEFARPSSEQVTSLVQNKVHLLDIFKKYRVSAPFSVFLAGPDPDPEIEYLSFEDGGSSSRDLNKLEVVIPGKVTEVVVKAAEGQMGIDPKFFQRNDFASALEYAHTIAKAVGSVVIQEKVAAYRVGETGIDWNVQVFVSRGPANEIDLVAEYPFVVRYSKNDGTISQNSELQPTTIELIGEMLNIPATLATQLKLDIAKTAVSACASIEKCTRETAKYPKARQDLYSVDIVVGEDEQPYVIGINGSNSGGIANLESIHPDLRGKCIGNFARMIERRAQDQHRKSIFKNLFPERESWMKKIVRFGNNPPIRRDASELRIDNGLPNVLFSWAGVEALLIAKTLSRFGNLNVVLSIDHSNDLQRKEPGLVSLLSCLQWIDDELCFFTDLDLDYRIDYCYGNALRGEVVSGNSKRISALSGRKDRTMDVLKQGGIAIPFSVSFPGVGAPEDIGNAFSGNGTLGDPGFLEELKSAIPKGVRELVVKPASGSGGKKIRFFGVEALEEALQYAQSLQDSQKAVLLEERVYSYRYAQTDIDWNLRVLVSRDSNNEYVAEKPFVVRYSKGGGPVNLEIDAIPEMLEVVCQLIGAPEGLVDKLEDEMGRLAVEACRCIEQYILNTYENPDVQQDFFGLDIIVGEDLRGYVIEFNNAYSGGMAILERNNPELQGKTIHHYATTIHRRAHEQFLKRTS